MQTIEITVPFLIFLLLVVALFGYIIRSLIAVKQAGSICTSATDLSNKKTWKVVHYTKTYAVLKETNKKETKRLVSSELFGKQAIKPGLLVRTTINKEEMDKIGVTELGLIIFNEEDIQEA